MSTFSAPPAKRPAAKVPEIVPFKDAPPEKQAEYKDLVKAMEEVNKSEDLTEKLSDEPSSDSAFPELTTSQLQVGDTILTISEDGRILAADKLNPEEIDPGEPSEEDKQNFIRALLGGKPFSKEVILFGELKLVFRDRTAAETEDMYKILDGLDPAPASAEEWAVQLDHHLAALTLKTIDGKLLHESEDLLAYRVEALLKQPRPLFQAILNASRSFERMAEILVSKAQDQGFWKAGGAA